MTLKRISPTVKHFLAWLFWYFFTSLAFVKSFASFTANEWLLVSYNYISLVLVFYSTSRIMQGYFSKISWPEFWKQNNTKRVHELLKLQLVYTLFVMVAYIAVSILMDRALSRFPYSYIGDHIEGRLGRVNVYVAGAVMYAHYKVCKRKHKQEITAAQKRVNEMIAKVFKFKELNNKFQNPSEVN
jgi:glucan phosphoethanolaminetransferase (alkaline phosphatase superfamily)